ncbi:MAG: TonB family protein [Terrimonas sp.]|nr:TonB family protein [Terrimonas sp.]
MTNQQILQADLLDILFEHRNKAYGAYALRKNYHLRLLKAIVTTLLIFGLFIFLTGLKATDSGNESPVPDKDVVISVVDMIKDKKEEIDPPKKRPEKQTEVKQVKSVNQIIIVPDNEKTDMPDQASILEALVADINKDGEKLQDPNQVIRPQTNEGDGNSVKEETATAPVVTGPSYLPSYRGGMEALMNFLRKNMRAPDDLEPGQKVTVMIKFLVDKEGGISEYQIVQSGGNELDKEVIRVMKKMPGWEPGKQNGRAISMYFTQPVTFVGQEE